MAISAGNAILNQYVPDMCVKDPLKNEALFFDPVTKSFKNGPIAVPVLLWEEENSFGPGDVITISNNLKTFVSVPRSEFGAGGGGATQLNDLTDVGVISPILGKTVLTYDINTSRWTNEFTSYNNLTDVPTVFTPDDHTHFEVDILDLDKYNRSQVDAMLLNKLDLVVGITGNITVIDPDGHIIDSGFDSSSFATSAQGDTADSALQAGANISLLVNDQGYLDGTASINDLQDVDSASPGFGQILKWFGTNWVPSDDIGDVSSVFGRKGDIIAESDDYSQYYLSDITSSELGELSDVNVTNASPGEILTFNGIRWTAGGVGSGGEVNDGINIGTGVGIYAGKTDVDIELKSLIPGRGVNITVTDTEITLEAPGDVEDAPADDNLYGRRNLNWEKVETTSIFESVRINYNAFGTISDLQDASDGIISTSIESSTWINFEFTHGRPPSSIVFYGYKDLGAPGYGYKMTQPATSSLNNEVRTGGTSGNPAELLTNMINGTIRLQSRVQETFADNNEHAFVFFLF